MTGGQKILPGEYPPSNITRVPHLRLEMGYSGGVLIIPLLKLIISAVVQAHCTSGGVVS